MEKERKQWRLSELDWKSEVIVFLLLMASAFFINRGISLVFPQSEGSVHGRSVYVVLLRRADLP